MTFSAAGMKEEFLKQYVLNRALGCRNERGLSGSSAAEEAIAAWYIIQKEMKKP